MRARADVVCVLVEGSYFHGVAVLLNALIRHGFAGELVVGYRGVLPAWLGGATADQACQVTAEVAVRCVPVAGDWHLSNLKPRFMQRIMTEIRPDLDVLYYFDADLLIRRDWADFARWAEYGVVLALDMAETYMPEQHVFRREWAALAGRCGRACRPISGYVNGGCVGVTRAHGRFVDVWAELMDQLARDGYDMGRIVADGKPEFAKMDQDVLNATVMATDVPLALLGQEAMDIFPSAKIMTHYMIHDKPWRRRYIRDALKGLAPARNELLFWDLANNPVASFTKAELRARRRSLFLARCIGFVRQRGLRE